MQRRRLYPIGPKDMDGRGIQKPLNFLLDVAGIKRENLKDAPQWPQIKDLEDIRTIIVHDSGFISPERRNEKSFCQMFDRYCPKLFLLPSIVLFGSDRDYLGVQIDLCTDFLGVLDQFFRQLFASAELLINPVTGEAAESYYSKEAQALQRDEEKELALVKERYACLRAVNTK